MDNNVSWRKWWRTSDGCSDKSTDAAGEVDNARSSEVGVPHVVEETASPCHRTDTWVDKPTWISECSRRITIFSGFFIQKSSASQYASKNTWILDLNSAKLYVIVLGHGVDLAKRFPMTRTTHWLIDYLITRFGFHTAENEPSKVGSFHRMFVSHAEPISYLYVCIYERDSASRLSRRLMVTDGH